MGFDIVKNAEVSAVRTSSNVTSRASSGADTLRAKVTLPASSLVSHSLSRRLFQLITLLVHRSLTRPLTHSLTHSLMLSLTRLPTANCSLSNHSPGDAEGDRHDVWIVRGHDRGRSP